MANKMVLVLGAGVSGLSSGIVLQQAGYDVKIWARELPQDTTSSAAAAIWYPYLCEPKDKVIHWGQSTVEYLRAHALPDPSSGCSYRTFTEIFTEPADEPWWVHGEASYRRVTGEELPDGYVLGNQTQALLMDTPIYLGWLQEQFENHGGVIEQVDLHDVRQAFAASSVLVNCTGLGSYTLFQDHEMYPVRGQIAIVRPTGFAEALVDEHGPGGLAYAVARTHEIILGGTAQRGNWNTDIDPEDTVDILRKAQALSPLLAEVDVVAQKVGLRPGRDSVRLEVEHFDQGAVVHNYGHGGAGYTLSWGCAREVADLVGGLD